MKLTALITMRNSAWTAGFSLRAAMQWCDSAVVMLHACTDLTKEVVAEIADPRIVVLEEPNPQWDEMDHRQRMLVTARENGATHLALIDDDEVLCGHLLPTIRDDIEQLRPGEVLQIPWIHLWRSMDQWRSDREWRSRFVSMAVCDKPSLRWQSRNGYHHHHRHPHGSTQTIKWREYERGGLLHFQHANWQRLLAKQTLYQMIEVVRWPDRKTVQQISQMYGQTMSERGLQCAAVPSEWLTPYQDIMPYLDLDEPPWQVAEIERLIAECGHEKFSGLDLNVA